MMFVPRKHGHNTSATTENIKDSSGIGTWRVLDEINCAADTCKCMLGTVIAPRVGLGWLIVFSLHFAAELFL